MAKLPGLTEYYATLGAPAINFGRGLLGYQDPVGTETMQNRMREIEAGRTKGNVGYDEYGLTPSAGRFTGGLMDLAVNNPADFALAGSVGKYDFSPEGRTGLKYDFTPDQDTGNTGSTMLDFINAGGLKGAFSKMGTAQASEMPIEPMSDLERDFPGMSTGDIIDSMNNRPFIGNQQTGIMQQAPQGFFDDNYGQYFDSLNSETDDEQVDYLPGQSSFKDKISNFGSNVMQKSGIGGLLGMITGNPIIGLIGRGIGALTGGSSFVGPKGSTGYGNDSAMSLFRRSTTGAQFFQGLRDKKAREDAAARGAAKANMAEARAITNRISKAKVSNQDSYRGGGGGGGGGTGSATGGGASPGSAGPGGSDSMGSF